MIVAMKIVPRVLLGACLAASASHALASALIVQVSDAAGAPVADAVVYVDGETPAPAKAAKAAEIAQRGLKFLPLVSVVQTGSKIDFPNYDKVKHHIYSFSPAKKFDQKLYSGVAAAPQVFDKPGTVVLGCNIHDRMVAYVRVVDTPYFAKTGADGKAHIELPAAGKYSVTAWHYNMSGAAAEQAVQVRAGETPAEFKLSMKPPALDAPGA